MRRRRPPSYRMWCESQRRHEEQEKENHSPPSISPAPEASTHAPALLVTISSDRTNKTQSPATTPEQPVSSGQRTSEAGAFLHMSGERDGEQNSKVVLRHCPGFDELRSRSGCAEMTPITKSAQESIPEQEQRRKRQSSRLNQHRDDLRKNRRRLPSIDDLLDAVLVPAFGIGDAPRSQANHSDSDASDGSWEKV